MVKVSHARCRRCGQARHRNVRDNLCARCWKLRKPEIQQEWRAIKGRRARKREALVQPQEVVVPLTLVKAVEEVLEVAEVGRPPKVRLTHEQKQEVVNLYTTTDLPVKEIAETYGLPDTGPFRILAEFGITWRRGDRTPDSRPGPKRELPPHIEAMKEVHVATPTPDPERVVAVNLDAPDPINLDAPNGRAPQVDLEEGGSRWSVVYVTTATLSVRADTFDQAAAKARAYLDPGIEIEMVRRERS